MIKIQNILNKYNIKPNKFMGQNFLIDENVLNKILETSNIEPNDVVLEVGPGLGVLTVELAKRAEKVIAVEKDKELCEILKKILIDQKIDNVEIVNADILKYEIKNDNYKVVANIPYYLTSPLIRMFLETENRPSEIILMIQKEVAERICAVPPKMSLLAVSVQFYAKPEIVSHVSKNSFYPVPKVDSAIIRIIPRINTNYDANGHKIDADKFFGIVKRGFASKRKMLKNNLSTILETNHVDLEKIGLNSKVRAENLTIENWIKLYTFLNCIDI